MSNILLDDIQLTAPAPNPVKGGQAQTIGHTGIQRYHYWVVAHFPIGVSVSGPIPVINAPDVLSPANSVSIVWDAALGATSYDVLRTQTNQFPNSSGLYALSTGLTQPGVLDQGGALTTYSPTGLIYGAPVDCHLHLNNRDYVQPTMELPCQVRVSTIIFSDGSTQTTAAAGPAGLDTWIQYNKNGAFGADQNFIWDRNNVNFLIQNNAVAQAPQIEVIATGGFGSTLYLQARNSQTNVITSETYGTDPSGPPFITWGLLIDSNASRGTYDARLPVQTGDKLFTLRGSGRANSFFAEGAEITAVVESNFTDSSCAAALIFLTNNNPNLPGTERMRITAAGNVGIGTGGPGGKLEIYSDTTTTENIVVLTTSTQNSPTANSDIRFSNGTVFGGIKMSQPSASVSNLEFSNFNGSARTVRMGIYGAAGNIGIGTVSPAHQLELSSDSAAKPATSTWTISSDLRLKKDISPFTDGLAVIEKLKPINFTYTGDGDMPAGLKGIGFAAQQVQPYMPYAVSSHQGKLKATDPSETDILDYNNHSLTMVLVNAVQELARRVAALEKP